MGVPVPLSGTNGVVSGALKPLLDMGRGGSSVNRITRSSKDDDPPGSEFNAGVAMDGGKRDKTSDSKAPTAESIQAIDYNRRLELFDTVCQVFAIPMEIRLSRI